MQSPHVYKNCISPGISKLNYSSTSETSLTSPGRTSAGNRGGKITDRRIISVRRSEGGKGAREGPKRTTTRVHT